jgi:hypothetical protein
MPYPRHSGITVILRDLPSRRWAAVRDDPTPEREALCDWLDFHRIPRWILDGAEIIRDEENHRIVIKGWLSEEDISTALIRPDGTIVSNTYVEQGEAGPLPFPKEIEFADG